MVTNISGERRTLTFSSAQQGEVVLSQDGIERYRWSRDKYFAAVIADANSRGSGFNLRGQEPSRF